MIDHFEKPRNVGSLDKKKPNIGTGIVGAPACGDVMKLQMEFDDDGKVTNAVFKVSAFFAVVLLQAVSAQAPSPHWEILSLFALQPGLVCWVSDALLPLNPLDPSPDVWLRLSNREQLACHRVGARQVHR